MRTLQINVQKGNEVVIQFLDEAFEEGLQQAAEAVKEYVIVRSKLGNPEDDPEPNEETGPDPAPIPLQPVDDDKKEKETASTDEVPSSVELARQR